MSEKDRIEAALQEIISYGGIDGAHHKQWVLDQVVRKLTGDEKTYRKWVKDYENDGEYEWDEGIPP